MALILKRLLIFSIILTKTNLNTFIIQTTQIKKENKEIILFSDLHLPYLKKSIQKHRQQNKMIKQEIKKSKKLLVFFEGYKEDQKGKFNKHQIKISKGMSPLAYFDTLTQSLKNQNVKIIPADPRKTINQAFLNCNQAIAILTNNSIEELLEGSATIKKEKYLSLNEQQILKNLERNCPSFDKIFLDTSSFIKKIKNKLEKQKNPKIESIVKNKLEILEKNLKDCKEDLQRSYSKNFPQIRKTPVLSLILQILLQHYVNLNEIWKNKLKTILDTVFVLHEESCDMLSINMLLKILKAKESSKIAIFAGQLNIKTLKKMLKILDYKKVKNLQDPVTISFVKNLDNGLFASNLTDIDNNLENNTHLINLPNEAFKPISQNLQTENNDSFFTKSINLIKSLFSMG